MAKLTFRKAAEIAGVSLGTIQARVRQGKTLEQAAAMGRLRDYSYHSEEDRINQELEEEGLDLDFLSTMKKYISMPLSISRKTFHMEQIPLFEE